MLWSQLFMTLMARSEVEIYNTPPHHLCRDKKNYIQKIKLKLDMCQLSEEIITCLQVGSGTSTTHSSSTPILQVLIF